MTIDLDLDQLEATAKAATQGTWVAADDGDGFTFVTAGTAIAEVLPSNRKRGEDAEHIAAARPEVVLALIERLRKAEAPTPPADDVRETLASIIQASRYSGRIFPADHPSDYRDADRILTAFEVRPRGTVTNAQVEAGARAISPRPDHWKDYVGVSRKVLEAAQGVQS